MIKIFLLLWFLHSSKACVGIAPIDVIGNKGKYCGERIRLTYPPGAQMTEFELIMKGEGNDCTIKERVSVLSQPKLIKAKSDTCILNITFTSNTLIIVSQVSVCIQDVLGIDCSSHNIKKNKNNIRTLRSIGEEGSRRQDEKQTPREEGILLSLGLSFILVITITATLLSCCYRKRRAAYKPQSVLDPEANGLTDYSYNSSHNDTMKSASYSARGSTLEHSNGFYPVPSTSPISVSFSGANRQSQVYISPALLNIPDVPPIMPPPRNSKVSISFENIADLSHADTINPFSIDHKRDQEEEDRHYAILEEPVTIIQGEEGRRGSSDTQRDITDDGLVETSINGKRAYFVLDVTVPNPAPLPVGEGGDKSIQPEDSLSSKIYHVLDPVASASADSPPVCSVCRNPINENEDESIYLVILPDEERSVSASLEQSQDASSAGDDPIYQVLEQPSLICQSCLCSEDEPIYHELEKPDPIYDRVRNIMRQGTSINSDGSSQHLYSTVHSLEINEDPNSSHLDSMSSKKRVYLRDIKKASSGDYASIPDDIHPPDSQGYSSGTKNQDQTTREAKGLSSLRRSLSNAHYTPLIIAQRKKSGSYHVLNVDEIWNHQQANRYAPVSIVMRKQSQPHHGFTRKGASMKSRKSYIRDQLIEGPAYNSDYEVPVPYRATPKPKTDAATSIDSRTIPIPSTIGHAIPPPPLLKAGSRKLSRQDALTISVEGKEKKLFAMRSEPCLSVNSDDYDHLDVLSQASSSPLPPPFSPLPSCASPSKNPFKKSFSSPSYSPLRRKSIDTKSSIQKTHLLSDSEEDDDEEEIQ